MKKFFGSYLPLFIAANVGGFILAIALCACALIGLTCFGLVSVWALIGGLALSVFASMVLFGYSISIDYSRRPLYEDERYHAVAIAIGKGGPRGATYLHRTAEEDAIFERECGGDIVTYIERMYPDYLTAQEIEALRKG